MDCPCDNCDRMKRPLKNFCPATRDELNDNRLTLIACSQFSKLRARMKKKSTRNRVK